MWELIQEEIWELAEAEIIHCRVRGQLHLSRVVRLGVLCEPGVVMPDARSAFLPKS